MNMLINEEKKNGDVDGSNNDRIVNSDEESSKET
jgi:hypothetical protein